MLFQPDAIQQGLCISASTNVASMYNPKGVLLSREERLLLRRREKRRRQIQELKSGCKRFVGILFSHIGLSGLVVAYTIIGALVFSGIEQENEKNVKRQAIFFRENNTLRMMRLFFDELDEWINMQDIHNNDTLEFFRFVKKYVERTTEEFVGIPVAVSHLADTDKVDIYNTTRNCLNETLNETLNLNLSRTSNETLNITFNCTQFTTQMPVTEPPIDPNLLRFLKFLQGKINFQLYDFTKQVVKQIEVDGWNGNDSMDDLKWSIAGAILYAVTVITTIGYGHATPKTSAGRFLTIVYALIGIPLMVLYLSNTGDYLADVFRVLYSKTCRTTCDRFCSVSVINAIFRSVIKRFQRTDDDDEEADEPSRLDEPVTNVRRHQVRRRKRVLLTAITSVPPDTDEGEEGAKVHDHNNDAQESANRITDAKTESNKRTKKTHPTIALLGERIHHLVASSGIVRISKSPRMITLMKKTKTSLAALVNPVTQLIQMVTSNFLYPADIPNPNAATIISNPSAASVHDFPQYAPGSGPTLMRDGTMLESTSQGPANHLMTIATVEGQGSMQPGLISTVIPNQMAGFPVDSSANLTAVSPYATINSSAAMNIPQLENLQNRRAEKPRYFTFEGQHRKFYLAARYLRSSQRQRRHNRRIKQRLKEQSRAEMNLLQNALSYGQIAANRRRTIDERTEVAESTQEQDSDILSLESEVPEEIRPQLICWKDIDLDLEVRSIEDEHELASIDQKEVRNADLFTEPCFPIQRKPTTKIRTKDLRLRRKARNRIQPIETGKTQTEDSARWVSECTDLHGLDFKCSHEEEYRSSTLKPQLPQDKGASQTKQSVQNHIPCAIPTTIKTKSPTTLQPTIYCNYMTLPFENSEHTLMNRITANHFTRPTPSGKHKPTVQLSPGSTYSKVTQKVPTEQLQNKLNTTPSTEQIPLHPLTPKTLTLPVMGTKDVRNVPLKMTQSLQNDNVKSLLQSTVISNPMALDGFKSESMEKEMAQGKSRLSIASSRGDLSSELHVQLSYYSQPDEAATEEDLSFFSFRDGFSSEEDFSKVTVPISLSLLIMTTYILIGTAVFCKWEDVNYLKWSYFCFITLSTIGFGDIVPGTKIDSENTKEKFVFITVYLAIGLIVFAMCFKLMQEEVVEKAKWFARKVGIIKEKEKKTEKSL